MIIRKVYHKTTQKPFDYYQLIISFYSSGSQYFILTLSLFRSDTHTHTLSSSLSLALPYKIILADHPPPVFLFAEQISRNYIKAYLINLVKVVVVVGGWGLMNRALLNRIK